VIHAGDLFDVLPTLGAASIDACVTDPPYGIGFMGREWDTFKPGTGKHRKLMHPRERRPRRSSRRNPNITAVTVRPRCRRVRSITTTRPQACAAFQQWTERWARRSASAC
jgi:DNA modification methylase